MEAKLSPITLPKFNHISTNHYFTLTFDKDDDLQYSLITNAKSKSIILNDKVRIKIGMRLIVDSKDFETTNYEMDL